jgi:uncharacterized protein YecT (DUF1311 family)
MLGKAASLRLESIETSFLMGEEQMKSSCLRVLAPILLSVLIIPWQLAGQDTTKPKKESTPEQKELQQKIKGYMVQRGALQRQAAQAFDAEIDRGKVGECRNATNTRDIEICLEKENEITERNYSAFTKAIRELLSLAYPATDQPPASGPTGMPLDAEGLTRELDSLQAAWQQYRMVVKTAAYDQYKGGTLAPVSSMEADLELVRSHMQELNFIYDGLLHL